MEIKAVPIKKAHRGSIVGNFFDWIDKNILDKSMRLLQYVLELMGAVILVLYFYKLNVGLDLVRLATTDFEIQKSTLYLDSIIKAGGALMGMIASLSVAVPGIIAAFKSLKTKWAGSPRSEYTKDIPPVGETSDTPTD